MSAALSPQLQARCRRLGIDPDLPTLTPRQRRDRKHLQSLDRWLEKVRGMAAQRLTNKRAASVLDKIDATLKAERDRRIRRLLAWEPPRQTKPEPAPAPVDPLDREIRNRVSAAPQEHHAILDALFAAFVMHNECYFGGKLKLPDIAIAPLANAQANCSIGPDPKRETLITFAEHTVKTRSLSDLSDILLHEMIHQSIGEKHGAKACWGSDKWQGHHADFRRVANNVAQRRSWPDCSEDVTVGAKAARFWPPRTHH